MKKITTILTILSATLMSACNCPCSDNSNEFEDLIAQDLSNTQCSENVWSFKDGILESTKDLILFTKKDYQNFEVELEFRIEKGSNGGFVFYASDLNQWTQNSLEIQICDNSTPSGPKGKCGAVFGFVAPEWDTQLSYGTWHKLRVVCNAKTINAWLDGKHVSSMNLDLWTDNKRNPDGTEIPSWLSKYKKCDMKTSGKIGLQGKHGKANCQYRNIKIRSL